MTTPEAPELDVEGDGEGVGGVTTPHLNHFATSGTSAPTKRKLWPPLRLVLKV